MDQLDGDQVFWLCTIAIAAIVAIFYIGVNAYLRAHGLELLV